MVTAKFENFEEAFSSRCSGCRRLCACGTTYYSSDPVWDWDDGEFEVLENDPKAISAYCSIGSVVFEGKEYVSLCDCWKERASKIIRFIDAHNWPIAAYLNKERQRLLYEAENAPLVEEYTS